MSLWSQHQAGQCAAECRYCTTALSAHQVLLIPPAQYADYLEKCKRLGVKSLVQYGN